MDQARELDARAATLMVELGDHPLAKQLSGLIGSSNTDMLNATIAQADDLLAKGFDPRQRRDREGRWTDMGTLGPPSSTSAPHLSVATPASGGSDLPSGGGDGVGYDSTKYPLGMPTIGDSHADLWREVSGGVREGTLFHHRGRSYEVLHSEENLADIRDLDSGDQYRVNSGGVTKLSIKRPHKSLDVANLSEEQLNASAMTLAVELGDHPMAKQLSGLVGTDDIEYLRATVAQADELVKLFGIGHHDDHFDPHQRRDSHGRWTDGGPSAADAITSTSHAHPDRPSFTPESVAKMTPDEADKAARAANSHVDNLRFQRSRDKKKVSSQQVESARQFASEIEKAAAEARQRHHGGKPMHGVPVSPYHLGGY